MSIKPTCLTSQPQLLLPPTPPPTMDKMWGHCSASHLLWALHAAQLSEPRTQPPPCPPARGAEPACTRGAPHLPGTVRAPHACSMGTPG